MRGSIRLVLPEGQTVSGIQSLDGKPAALAKDGVIRLRAATAYRVSFD